jgi:hypothetical protein
MNWSRFKRDTTRNVFGKSKLPTVVGTLVTAAYTLLIMLVPLNLGLDVVPYLGPLVGGFTAGAVLGTNVYDGVMYGTRAAAYGIVIVAFVATVGSFVLFLQATGQQYFYFSSFVGLVIIFALVPLAGFAGALAGPVGTLVRRTVVPRQYNPPVR